MKVLFIILIITPSLIFCEVKADLWSRWDRSNSNNTVVVDHSMYEMFLTTYINVRGNMNLVNYKYVNDEDHKMLKNYINYLSQVKVTTLNRTEQKAYWINLYNALTIDIVLNNYPVKTIRDIKLSGIFIPGPWRSKVVTIEGIKVSLNDIEHRILRPIWNDRRVHYALNCASMGCPEIQITPYSADNMEDLLNRGELNYINNKHGVTITENTVVLSSIYKWFKSDFAESEEKILDYIESLINEDKLEQFKVAKNKIKYEYDWSLNKF